MIFRVKPKPEHSIMLSYSHMSAVKKGLTHGVEISMIPKHIALILYRYLSRAIDVLQ